MQTPPKLPNRVQTAIIELNTPNCDTENFRALHTKTAQRAARQMGVQAPDGYVLEFAGQFYVLQTIGAEYVCNRVI